jgi:hypothetical protein
MQCEDMGGKLGLNINTCRVDGESRDLSNPSIVNGGEWTLFKNNADNVKQMFDKTREKFHES